MKRGEEETGDGEGGDRERKRGRLAHVQGYHWQKSRHLPAASWRQQHSARRMLPCAASVGAGVFRLGLCVCVHSVDAAELHQCVKAQGKDHMQESAALTEGTALKNRKKKARSRSLLPLPSRSQCMHISAKSPTAPNVDETREAA